MNKNITFTLLPHQKALYNSKFDTAVLIGGRGCGKSIILSIIVFLSLIKGERSMVFAQNFHALKYNLFTEIENRFNENGIPCKVNNADMTITTPIAPNGICFGFSYSSIDSCRGTTQIKLVCYDELCMAPQDLFAVVNPCLRLPLGQKPKIIAATSPVMGSFYNRWAVEEFKAGKIDLIKAKMRDNKFLSEESIKVIENTFTDERMKAQELDGEIITDIDDTCIIRQSDLDSPEFYEQEINNKIIIGIDAAGTGQDKTVIAFRRGHKILDIKTFDRISGDSILSEIRKFLIEHNLRKENILSINLDMAYSEAYYEALIKEFEQTKTIAFSSKSPDAKYTNIRAYGYFKLAKYIKEGLKITDSDVKEELLNTHWKLDNYDRIILQPKEEIKFVIRRSPDKSDAIMLTCIDDEDNNYVVSKQRCSNLTHLLFK